MAVRTHLPWPWRAVVGVVLVALVGGMWWWGFDFGQIFGGFNRKEVEARVATLETDTARQTQENEALRAANAALESELAMTRGAQQTMQRQVQEVTSENTQLKEDLAFLQKLVVDSNKQPGVSIQRLNAERGGDEVWNYSILVVRGGNPKGEFEGSVRAGGDHRTCRRHRGGPGVDDQPARGPAGHRRGAEAQDSSIISGLTVRSGFRQGRWSGASTRALLEAGSPAPRDESRTLIIP